MSKVFRNLLILGVILTVLTGSFVLSGCSNYEFNEEDFRLTVEVDKTQARVGDTVTITATLENLSGRNIRIRAQVLSLEYIIGARVIVRVEEFRSYSTAWPCGGFGWGGAAGPRRNHTIAKDAVIIRRFEYVITHTHMHEVEAELGFNIRRGLFISNEPVWMQSSRINIQITEEIS